MRSSCAAAKASPAGCSVSSSTPGSRSRRFPAAPASTSMTSRRMSSRRTRRPCTADGAHGGTGRRGGTRRGGELCAAPQRTAPAALRRVIVARRRPARPARAERPTGSSGRRGAVRPAGWQRVRDRAPRGAGAIHTCRAARADARGAAARHGERLACDVRDSGSAEPVCGKDARTATADGPGGSAGPARATRTRASRVDTRATRPPARTGRPRTGRLARARRAGATHCAARLSHPRARGRGEGARPLRHRRGARR